MALVTHKFKLDLTPGASRQVLYTSQGDIGRPFEADLYWNGSPWTATGTTANIRGKKPDDTVFDYTATVSGTAVTFETTEQMTIISGPVECELVFSNDGDIIASANFVLIVEDSPYNPDAPSESVIPGLLDLVEESFVAGTDNIGDNQVTTNKLANSAVTTAKLADGSVTSAKLGDSAVTNAKINDGAVGTSKLGASAVTSAKLADNAVETAKIKDAAVTNAKLAGGSVSWDKLASAVQGRITTAEGDIDNLEEQLASVAKALRKTLVDVSDYSGIQALVRAGLAKEAFNIGDQLVVPYTATNGTTYDMPFDVVDFREVTLENGDVVPGMVLQSHYATLEAVQFDASETTRPANDDYNGQIAQYGWGRWAKSGIRQWLNSAETAGHWWTSQNDYDEAPTQHATVNGFMHGLPSDFLAVLKPVKVETARDYRYPTGGASGTYVYDTTYDKFFLTSKEEEYTVVNEPNHREGLPFQYWIERLTPEALEKGEALPQQNYASADNTHALTSHIRYALENHTSAHFCRLRSAYRTSAYDTWSVYSAGSVSTYSAYAALRCAPACVIC